MTNKMAQFLLGIVMGFIVGTLGMMAALCGGSVVHHFRYPPVKVVHTKVVPISNPHKDTLQLNTHAKIDLSQIEDMRSLTAQ